jgi:hypothetical protein
MAFSDFTLADLEERFGINNQRKSLFTVIEPILPSEKLQLELAEGAEMPIKSEKAKSEWIVVPILKELRNRNNKFLTIYSGEILVADKEKGLIGECDFIIAKDTNTFDVSLPIFMLVEAKKNDMEEGIRQCAAQLVGAKAFNQKKGIALEKLYGCSTTGDDWQFLELSDQLYIDNRKYFLVELKELLGIFQQIIDFYKNRIQ